jgi:predicted aldo/keto reductase-like oxidoreductase
MKLKSCIHNMGVGTNMTRKNKSLSRRDFMKIAAAAGVSAVVSPMERFAGAAGVGAVISPTANIPSAMAIAESQDQTLQQVPVRPFGRTGVDISILALGGVMNFLRYQLFLRQAFKMGVTCWDTSRHYIGGKSEKGIGKYFSKFPEDRKSIFLITSSGHSVPDKLTVHLNQSLQRMQTAYIDLFLIQAVSNVKQELTKDIESWAENAKALGKIRFFGFSTHKNMGTCLSDAAKLGWIDGILTTYNYRLMHTDHMKKAVDDCVEAGIGLMAMKTQAWFVANIWSDLGKETDAAVKLNQRFLDKGYTIEQAKLKSVWENPANASICSHMPNMTLLQANVAAALNKTALSFRDKKLLQQYARETSRGYCAGCAEKCEEAISHAVPISDIMRYLMYYSSYADRQKAIQLFKNLPIDTRKHISGINYSKAEQCCPQRMPIAKLMRLAAARLEC